MSKIKTSTAPKQPPVKSESVEPLPELTISEEEQEAADAQVRAVAEEVMAQALDAILEERAGLELEKMEANQPLMPPTSTDKPWWQSYKLIVSMLVTFLLFATVLTLVLAGKVEVSSQQLFDLGQWLMGILVGGHSVQRVGESVAGAIAIRKAGN